jgi:hypothetical protein
MLLVNQEQRSNKQKKHFPSRVQSGTSRFGNSVSRSRTAAQAASFSRGKGKKKYGSHANRKKTRVSQSQSTAHPRY